MLVNPRYRSIISLVSRLDRLGLSFVVVCGGFFWGGCLVFFCFLKVEFLLRQQHKCKIEC